MASVSSPSLYLSLIVFGYSAGMIIMIMNLTKSTQGRDRLYTALIKMSGTCRGSGFY